MIHRRPHCSATNAVVPEPHVGSRTRSPGSVDISRHRSTTLRCRLNDVELVAVRTALPCRVRPDCSQAGRHGKSSMIPDVAEVFPSRERGRHATSRSMPSRLVFHPPVAGRRKAFPSTLTREDCRLADARRLRRQVARRRKRAPRRELPPRLLLLGESRRVPSGSRAPMCSDTPRRRLDSLASKSGRYLTRLDDRRRVPETVVVDPGEAVAVESTRRSRRRSDATKFSGPNTSSMSERTRWTFSSPICTKHDPDSVRRSRATTSRSRRYARYEWMPSSQVSRNALICSASRAASSSLPSLTSRLRADTCQFDPNLMPYGGSM